MLRQAPVSRWCFLQDFHPAEPARAGSQAQKPTTVETGVGLVVEMEEVVVMVLVCEEVT